MSNDLQGKNILFYSESQSDTLSKEILKILKESPLLNEQFYKFSVNNPKLKIPELIVRTGVVPVIAISGFNELIKGPDALKWIKGNSLNANKELDFEYVDVSKCSGSSSSFSSVGDTFKRSSMSQAHNADFNKGTEYADSSYYATLGDANKIDTFDENNGPASDSGRLFNNFKNNRERDVKNINSQMHNEMNQFEQNSKNFNNVLQPQLQYNPYLNSNPNEQQERERKFQEFLKKEDTSSSTNYVNRQFQNIYTNKQPLMSMHQSQMTRSRDFNAGASSSRNFPVFNNSSSQSSNITPYGNDNYASW